MSQPPRWSVLVVRGWIESGRLRVRLLRTGSTGADDQATALTAAHAAHIVQGWLDNLAPDDAPADERTDAAIRRDRRGANEPPDGQADGGFLGSAT
jgi:hypothetical protein